MSKVAKSVKVLVIVIICSLIISAGAFYVSAGAYVIGNKDKWYENLYSEGFKAEIQRIEYLDNESLYLHLKSEMSTFFIEICSEQIDANIKDLKAGDSIFKLVDTYKVVFTGSNEFELVICE